MHVFFNLQNMIQCEDSIQLCLHREHSDRQMGFENRSDKCHKFLLKKSAIISATCLHMFSSMTVLSVAYKLHRTDNSVASWGFQERSIFCKNSVLLIHTQGSSRSKIVKAVLIIGQIIPLWKNQVWFVCFQFSIGADCCRCYMFSKSFSEHK